MRRGLWVAMVWLSWGQCADGVSAPPPPPPLPDLVFWDNVWPSDTDGPLAGTVLLAQTHVTPAQRRIAGDVHPGVVAGRTLLVMFRPQNVEPRYGVTLFATTPSSTTETAMEHPRNIPKQPWWTPGAERFVDVEERRLPTSVDFAACGVGNRTFRTALRDPAALDLAAALSAHRNITVALKQGAEWSEVVSLPPPADDLHGTLLLVRNDGSASTVVIPPPPSTNAPPTGPLVKPGAVSIAPSGRLVFCNIDGHWVDARRLAHSRYVFAKGFYSAVVHGADVEAGLELKFTNGDSWGKLKVAVHFETALLVNTIDIGVFTKPQGDLAFAQSGALQRSYWKSIPLSTLRVAQYAPVRLDEVVLPDGTMASNSTPSGQLLAAVQALFPYGIHLANYGVTSSSLDPGVPARGRPSAKVLAGQVALQQVVAGGGVRRFGNIGSVVDGVATLRGGSGPKAVSRALGLHFGLADVRNEETVAAGLDERGYAGYMHRPADSAGSAWGWDDDANVLVPNFSPQKTGALTCCCRARGVKCVVPFHGYPFNRDPMAGGTPAWGLSPFVLHHPHAAQRIQAALEGAVSFDRYSPTGFSCAGSAAANPFDGKRPSKVGEPVTTLLGYYTPAPEPSPPAETSTATATAASTSDRRTAYVYPPLYGSYGVAYLPDDYDRPPMPSACELHVTRGDRRRAIYTLGRGDEPVGVMRQFHVQVLTEDTPTHAAVICNMETQAQRALPPPQVTLHAFINGVRLEDSSPRHGRGRDGWGGSEPPPLTVGGPAPAPAPLPLPEPLVVDKTTEEGSAPTTEHTPFLIVAVGGIAALVTAAVGALVVAAVRYRNEDHFHVPFGEAVDRHRAKLGKRRKDREGNAIPPIFITPRDLGASPAASPLQQQRPSGSQKPYRSPYAVVSSHVSSTSSPASLPRSVPRSPAGSAGGWTKASTITAPRRPSDNEAASLPRQPTLDLPGVPKVVSVANASGFGLGSASLLRRDTDRAAPPKTRTKKRNVPPAKASTATLSSAKLLTAGSSTLHLHATPLTHGASTLKSQSLDSL
eukprot:TRINITY_DN13733_c0_g1_i1.p1 TRINITY_DN13733_c0_g1~~TRINITY_DN13733_c0_g1_i1.p1  ORF type:complete len:1042 (+),score=135.84 TRINITY_DN13733_c0_g1_i1:93-3218(+)